MVILRNLGCLSSDTVPLNEHHFKFSYLFKQTSDNTIVSETSEALIRSEVVGVAKWRIIRTIW